MTKTMLAMALLTALQASAANPPKRYEGRIESFDAQSGKIKLSMEDRSTGNWTLIPTAGIFDLENKPAARSAIRPGDDAWLTVTEDGMVHYVRLEGAPWAKAVEGGKLHRFDGRIIAIQSRPPKLRFEVGQPGNARRAAFTPDANTKLVFATRQGMRPATQDDFKDGQNVLVLMDWQAHRVTMVQIRE